MSPGLLGPEFYHRVSESGVKLPTPNVHLPFKAATERLLNWNTSVLPWGEDPGDEIGADPQDRKQERDEDQQAHQPHVHPGRLGETSGNTAENPVGTATETNFANGIK